MDRLKVENLGPIESAEIEFGDLTVLIGPQASGKSLLLQMFKFAKDKKQIYSRLKTYGYYVTKKVGSEELLDYYLGRGVSSVCKQDNTAVFLNSSEVNFTHPNSLSQNSPDRVFYVPAQRILSVSEGRFKSFNEFDATTPYVLRDFSEILRLFSQHGLGGAEVIFPMKSRLKGALKNSLQRSVFYGGEITLKEREGQKKLAMKIGGGELPFMTLSAGQKEFMPLLMAFYCLTGPPTPIVNKGEYEYVIIEEPEMGLHPKAIVAILLEIIELIQGGKKVVISTHSSIFLDFAWAFNFLKNNEKAMGGEVDIFKQVFDLEQFSGVDSIFEGLLARRVNTYFFGRAKADRGVTARDISSLDAWSDDPEVAEWGGIASFSRVMSDLVARYVD